MIDSLYIAVDLGAGSGRIFLASVAENEFHLEEIHRFQYPPRFVAGHLRWDLKWILSEIFEGLKRATARARQLARPVASIGVDTWGVDYGIVGEDGTALEDPVAYRDDRTKGVIDDVAAVISRNQLYAATGIQFLPFNTIFQVYAHNQEGWPPGAERLLLMPDLINMSLTGRAATEYTNATTTQLVNASTRTWDESIIKRLALPRKLFTEIVMPGETIGLPKPEVAGALGLEGVPVVAPATHDTGSAVAGTPLQDGWAYISSGTWSLVGVELSEPLINDETARQNFTNEGGVDGTIRFLKNVAGLWLLECCRREWQERGLNADYDSLLAAAASNTEDEALIFPDDPRFFSPRCMTEAINEQLVESGQAPLQDPGRMTKVILDSLACRYASVIQSIESLTARQIGGIQIVGGGSLNDYLNQATASAAGRTVRAGPVEATVIGNVLVQAIASGRFGSLKAARQHVAATIQQKVFQPLSIPVEIGRRYRDLEARYA